MNKIHFQLTLIAALFLLSCSNSDSYKFTEKEANILLDGIDAEIANSNVLYLHENLYIVYTRENKEITEKVFLQDLDHYLWDFYWIIDNDTIRRFKAEKRVPYGKTFFKLFLMDIWGDTLSHNDSIFLKEPISVTLLSPVDNFSEFSENDTVVFQYKLNGLNDNIEIESHVYTCSEDCTKEESTWKKLNGDSLELSETIFWQVKAFTSQDSAFSEIRKIWLKE